MDRHTLESIRRIKEASKNGKLVMFIGAGVSALSGYPNWGGLIEKLDLSSNKKEYYSDEEFLTIPQKYYNSRGHKEYYDIIKQTFDIELEPNFIHDEIFRLNPTHIITTNYDNLIEKAITKKGLFYDVISRDRDVANTKSKNFIIKMHGEIKHENIVLKEEDFINYDNNFKLIETMVKSIIASNLVVFVGYSIKEFNVKKILSWVKELQGDSFQPAYWLYTGNTKEKEDKVTKEDYDYYKGRGINIIDYNDLKVTTDKIEGYYKRYKLLLSSICDYEKNNEVENERGIEYLYNNLLPLNQLNRIRRKDLIEKIGDDYIIDDVGNIYKRYYNNKDKCLNYIEEFNELYIKITNGEEVEYSNKEKYKLISTVLKKANILAYISRETDTYLTYEFNDNNIVNSEYYKFNYLDVNESTIKINKNAKEDYIKAFNLYKLGRYKEAYNLYSNIAIMSFEEKNYLLYYLSQVNRYWIGKLIKVNKYLYEDIFVKQVIRDIENIDIENLFNSLPSTFKNDFKGFEDISNFKFIHNNLFNISDVSKKVDYNRQSNVVEFGQTKLDSLLYKTKEIIEFCNENYIIYDDSSEFKLLLNDYIVTILSEYSSKFNERLAINYTAELFGIKNKDNYIEIDYMDIVIMTRYIDNKQLKNIFKKLNITNLQIRENLECISILENIYNYLENIKYISRYLREKLRNELENIIFLLRYIKLSTEEFIKVIEIIRNINENDLNMDNKIQFLDKQELYNSNKDSKIVEVLDRWLYDEFSNHIILRNRQNNNYSRISTYINVKSDTYVSILDRLVDSQINYLDKEDDILSIVCLTPILSKGTLEHLKNRVIDTLNNNFDFNLFNKAIRYNLIKDGYAFEEKIYNYIKTLEKSRPNGRVCPDIFEQTLENLGILIFNNKINVSRFLEFIKYSDKLSFLINPNEFDYSKFKESWILEYNKAFHEAISKTKAGIKVKNILEKYIKSGQGDEDILELYFDIYHQLRLIRSNSKLKRRFIK